MEVEGDTDSSEPALYCVSRSRSHRVCRSLRTVRGLFPDAAGESALGNGARGGRGAARRQDGARRRPVGNGQASLSTFAGRGSAVLSRAHGPWRSRPSAPRRSAGHALVLGGACQRHHGDATPRRLVASRSGGIGRRPTRTRASQLRPFDGSAGSGKQRIRRLRPQRRGVDAAPKRRFAFLRDAAGASRGSASRRQEAARQLGPGAENARRGRGRRFQPGRRPAGGSCRRGASHAKARRAAARRTAIRRGSDRTRRGPLRGGGRAFGRGTGAKRLRTRGANAHPASTNGRRPFRHAGPSSANTRPHRGDARTRRRATARATRRNAGPRRANPSS